MTTHYIGSTPIQIRPIDTHLRPGDHVVYTPPAPADAKGRPGTIRAISGVSALVFYTDYPCIGWAPLERLDLATSAPSAS